MPTELSWAGIVLKRLEDVDFDRAVEDVRPFLEPGVDVGLITAGILRQLLRRRAIRDPTGGP